MSDANATLQTENKLATPSLWGARWRPASWPSWVLLNGLIALAFWGVARLGLLASIGPGETSPIWPPSGLALSALLVWGPAALPGLVLGSWANDAMSGTASGLLWSEALGYGLLMTLGTAMQWMLVRRLVGNWDHLLTLQGAQLIVRFLASVVLGAALGPLLGVLVMWVSSQVAGPDVANAFLTWWVGDVTGMLVITPLLLAVLYRGMRQRYLLNQAFPALSIGLGLTLAGSFMLGNTERNGVLQRANAELNGLTSSLQSQIELAEADLRELAALHFGSTITKAEFNAAATTLRQRHDWLSAVAYLGRLSGQDRDLFEATHGAVKELQVDGSVQTAPRQLHHWVVQRLSPEGGQEARLGLDEGSDLTRREAIDTAVVSNQVAATGIIDNLQLAKGDAAAVLLYLPVFEGSTSDRLTPSNASGVVAAGLHLRTLLASAIVRDQAWRQSLLLVSDDAKPRALRLKDDRIDEIQPDALQADLPNWRSKTTLQRSIRVGQRNWLLYSQPHLMNPLVPTPQQTVALLVGLAFTGMLGSMLVARAKRDVALRQSHDDLERLVSARTAALADSNTGLERLATQRQELIEKLSGQARDIAHREAVLRAVLRSIPDPMWVKDTEGRYLHSNLALETALGLGADGLLGKTSADVLPAASAVIDANADAEAMVQRTGNLHAMTQTETGADGIERTFMVTRASVRTADGRVLGTIGSARDITEQLARESELRRFRWLAESASQGFALGQMDGQVDYLNHSAQLWLGEATWPPPAKRMAKAYYDTAALARLRTEVMPAIRRYGRWSGEIAIRGLPGAPMPPVWVSYFVLRDDQGASRALAMTMTDISERRRFESELGEARDRAEAANRAKSVFLANMSHEIRTPLNAVLGYAQLLREQQGLPAAARSQVDAILNGGARLLRLINDVLDLSKIEAGAMHLHTERIDLHRQLEDCLRLMQERANRSGITLQGELDLPDPLVVSLDRGKFDQVLLNLLGNALKFTPTGGLVTLRAKLDGDTLAASVQDSGPGISAAELETLFTPFVQGSSGAQQGGTGLGLVLSRKLIQAMGGDLWLESTPGQGATARLQMPLRREAVSELPQQSATIGPDWQLVQAGSCRVLVVEDDPASRDVLCQLLRRVGCVVVEAGDGAEALQVCQGQAIDIVLTDLRMPNMDGLQLRDALAANTASQHWPVVAVTASSLAHEREDHLRRGFAEFLAKPYPFTDILRVLRDFGGAVLQPPSEAPAALEPSSSTDTTTVEVASDLPKQELIGWADDGDVAALRTWLETDAAKALPAPLRDDFTHALNRYDFDAILHILHGLDASASGRPM